MGKKIRRLRTKKSEPILRIADNKKPTFWSLLFLPVYYIKYGKCRQ